LPCRGHNCRRCEDVSLGDCAVDVFLTAPVVFREGEFGAGIVFAIQAWAMGMSCGPAADVATCGVGGVGCVVGLRLIGVGVVGSQKTRWNDAGLLLSGIAAVVRPTPLPL